MKKFLSKLPVMIAMWIVTVAILTVMIIMAVRPVSYGWEYKCDEQDVMGFGENQEITITFEDERTYDMFVEMEGLTFEMDMWYLRNDDEYVTIGIAEMPPLVQDYMGETTISSIEYVEKVEYLKSDREFWREIWLKADRISAFKCEMNGVEFVCNGAIAFVVVFSILFATGLGFSTISTIFFVKGRKKIVIADEAIEQPSLSLEQPNETIEQSSSSLETKPENIDEE